MTDVWQTDTCIGSWHYRRGITYKTPKIVIDMLCDFVSRNGNLMLNIPLPNSGEPDEQKLASSARSRNGWRSAAKAFIQADPGKYLTMDPGSTRPAGRGMNERGGKDLTAADVSFTTKASNLYAFVMGWPEKEASIPSLAWAARTVFPESATLSFLGNRGKFACTQDESGFRVQVPEQNLPHMPLRSESRLPSLVAKETSSAAQG